MNFAPMVVNLLGFKVNVIDRASQLSFGPSSQVDTFLSTKRNMGFGEDNGDLSPVYMPLNIILDQDLFEANANKTSAV
jgi:hypothetical protein